MEPEDVLNLLPPLPSLEELQDTTTMEQSTAEESATSKRSYVTLSDEEFERALKGEVTFAGTSLTVHEVVEQTISVAQSSAQAITAQPEDSEAESGLSQDVLDGYGEAAALRYTYRLDAITPVAVARKPRHYKDMSRKERDEVFTYLTGRSEIVSDARGNTRWMLRDDERRAALVRLIETNTLTTAVEQARADAAEELREASELLKSTATEKTPLKPEDELAASRVEETLWDFLTKPQTASANERRQLLINQRVVEWVHGLPGVTVPSSKDVTRQLAKETLLQTT